MNRWEGTENDEPIKRLPEDIEAEESFLSTCFSSPKRSFDACLSLTPDDFAHPTHKIIFQALQSIQHQDTEINSLTLKDEVLKMGKLQLIGGPATIFELLSKDDVDRPEVLAEIILQKSKLRQLIKTGSRIVDSAMAVGNYSEIVSEASEAITRLSMADPGKQIITDLSDLLDDLESHRQITTQNGGKAMSWGDESLDRLCPIPRGEPTLIVARPGVGKSALGIQILTATIEKSLGRPLFLSLEMNREKIKARVAAHLSGVNSRSFRDGDYNQIAIDRVIDRKRVLSGMKLLFPNQQCQVEEIESLVKHAVDVYGIDCVVLDQFSHIHPPREAKKENFAIANSMMSQKLTALAKNLNLGWVTLAQLNRDGDDSRRPNMKDLADTDRLAKDAAVIFGMWSKGDSEAQEVHGTIIKNRDDGFKGWARKLKVDYGTCQFHVEERETETPTPFYHF
jgi:replicative DNA helicase